MMSRKDPRIRYQKTWSKASVTLSGGDITNQYIDFAHAITASSLDLWVDGGAIEAEGVGYTVSLMEDPEVLRV
jgi:hypothetical protein